MTADILDVLIVGAGPTGTALAVDLARRGLNIRIVDKAAASFEGSRAKGVQPRTLEVLQDLGALDDVLNGGGEYPLLGVHLGPLVAPWRMIPRKRPTAGVPFPNTWLIPQFRTDAALHARLNALGRKVEFGKTLTGLNQDAQSVVAKLSGPAGVEELTARYVVGADGGSSAVRQELGVEFAGATHEEDRMIIADAATFGLSRARWHIWPGKSGQFVAACPLPGGDLFQWMVRLAPEERPDLTLAALNARIQQRVKDRRVILEDLRWTSVFRPNIRMVGDYRRGRVFLAGDAAHVHTPAGAQGLNTGIQDAYNLGWKLAQVLAGADPALLDTYQAERLPIAAAVLALSTKKYDGIAKLDPASIKRGKDERQLALTYRDGPLAIRSAGHTKTLQAGDRAPDADLVAASGRKVRLFDSFMGPHFTAIAYGDSAARALEAFDWPASGAAVKRVLVNVAKPPAGRLSFKDLGGFRRLYGLTGDALILVRPDGYIGSIATVDMLAGMSASLRMMAPPPHKRSSTEDVVAKGVNA